MRWSFDGWLTSDDSNTRDTGLGAYILDLPTSELVPGSRVCFTFHWPEADKWEGTDFEVIVEPDAVRTKDVTSKPAGEAFTVFPQR